MATWPLPPTGRLSTVLIVEDEPALRAAGDDQKVVLEVADRGPGIPAQLHKRVIERFFRVAPTHEAAGVGLGLAIAQRAVEAHGGSIELHDHEPGLVVTVSLPRGPVHPDPVSLTGLQSLPPMVGRRQ